MLCQLLPADSHAELPRIPDYLAPEDGRFPSLLRASACLLRIPATMTDASARKRKQAATPPPNAKKPANGSVQKAKGDGPVRSGDVSTAHGLFRPSRCSCADRVWARRPRLLAQSSCRPSCHCCSSRLGSRRIRCVHSRPSEVHVLSRRGALAATAACGECC